VVIRPSVIVVIWHKLWHLFRGAPILSKDRIDAVVDSGSTTHAVLGTLRVEKLDEESGQEPVSSSDLG
jgi:hypothetical protein